MLVVSEVRVSSPIPLPWGVSTYLDYPTHSHARDKDRTATMAVGDAAPQQRGEELGDVEDGHEVT